MEPITMTAVASYVALKFLDQFLKEEGYGRIRKFFFPAKKYKERLVQIIYQTISEFEQQYPIKSIDRKFPFYQSQVLFEDLTKSTLLRSNTKNFANILEEFNRNSLIIVPTKAELEVFYSLFYSKIKSDVELKKLNIEDNYKTEIFEISKVLLNLTEDLKAIHEDVSHLAKISRGLSEEDAKDILQKRVIYNADYWIDRSRLMQDLLSFSKENNGVIIGKPGVGKSASIDQVALALKDKGIPVLVLALDVLADGSDNAIQQELKINEEWITFLNKIEISEDIGKGVLIFDAFDAVRDGISRKQFISQIRRAIADLPKWNVMASVRTYDATKSKELLELFPKYGNDENIICRNFEIPTLDEDELLNALSQRPQVKAIYSECTDELKEVLRTPYFLILLDSILQKAAATEINQLKVIKSETQLLNAYWKQKVSDTEGHILKEKLLLDFTNILVHKRSLSCEKSDFLGAVSGTGLTEYGYLNSEHIITEYPISNRIGYGHNILFDFAVNQLCISRVYEKLHAFLKADPTRPYFLRPSFIYFFTQLWYDNPTSFWEIYWRFQNDNEKDIELFVRLILNSVIASEYSSVKELSPIIDKKNTLVTHQLLQSIKFIRANRLREQEVDLLLLLSEQLEIPFLWDFSFLLEKAIAKTPQDFDLSKCGIAVRHFFIFILKNRSNNINIDFLGSVRGIDLLLKTYHTSPTETRQLLEEVLQFLNTPNFNIRYFIDLTEGLGQLLNYDIDFIAKVYNILYLHKEDSTEETYMGGTVVMQFKSNRKQDFESCLYRLERLFPNFIKTAPQIALKTGLIIINESIKSNPMYSSDNAKTYKFQSQGVECKYTPDHSFIWKRSFEDGKAGKIAVKTIEYLESIINNNSINELCQIYFENADCAFTWKIFLELGAKHPEPLKEELFLLSTIKVILENNDTTYEVGEVLGQIVHHIKKPQIEEIEKTILEILNSTSNPAGYVSLTAEQLAEIKKTLVSKLLNKIPKEMLKSKASFEFIGKNEVVVNSPLFNIDADFTSEPVTTEMWMQHQGVDIKKEDNSKLIKQIQIVESFNHTFINKYPHKAQYAEILKSTEELFRTVEKSINNIDEKVGFSCLNAIARALAIISRDINSLNKTEINIIKTAIVYCYNYISEYDKTFDNNSSPATGYSSTPRIDAAEALTNLAAVEEHREIIDLVRQAAEDINPVVRFNVIKSISRIKDKYRNDYWDLVYSRLEKETDFFTSGWIINNIRTTDEQPDVINKAIEIANKKEGFFDSNNSFIESFASLLLFLFSEKNNAYAEEVLDNRLKNAPFVRTVVFKLFEFVDPSRNPNNDYSKDKTLNDKLFVYLQKIVETNGQILSKFQVEDFSKENAEIKNALEIIDQVVQRSYFVLDLNERIRDRFPVSEDNRKSLYFKLKPILQLIVSISTEIAGGGVILAHTAHYSMEILNGVVKYDAKEVLTMACQILKLSDKTGYTFDPSSIKEVVSLTEQLLVDNRELLAQPNSTSFNELIEILNIYSNWPEALELLWKLDDIFK